MLRYQRLQPGPELPQQIQLRAGAACASPRRAEYTGPSSRCVETYCRQLFYLLLPFMSLGPSSVTTRLRLSLRERICFLEVMIEYEPSVSRIKVLRQICHQPPFILDITSDMRGWTGQGCSSTAFYDEEVHNKVEPRKAEVKL
jgi:hypothetical protein